MAHVVPLVKGQILLHCGFCANKVQNTCLMMFDLGPLLRLKICLTPLFWQVSYNGLINILGVMQGPFLAV